MLDIKRKAPAFHLKDETGTVRRLSDYSGSWVIIYFYPKDDTPGCTKEACTIAEIYDEFASLGVTVLGVSKDSSESHAQFKEKYHLPFTLLSDESTKMIQAYGAWQEHSMYGKKFMGTARITYVVDPKGKIVAVYPKVSPASHALQLLKDLKTIQGT
ncbi:peroxiredoxin [Candidatus Parcubacteria bacterium]|nr:peroxiredoxin [Candidatus Parcubacteria bacterium]